MSKTKSSSNSHVNRQLSGQTRTDGLPITPQNIKMPPVKPPKSSQPESKSQQPEGKK